MEGEKKEEERGREKGTDGGREEGREKQNLRWGHREQSILESLCGHWGNCLILPVSSPDHALTYFSGNETVRLSQQTQL